MVRQLRCFIVLFIVGALLITNVNAISPDFAKKNNLKAISYNGLPKNMKPISSDKCYGFLGPKLKEPDEFLINPTNSFGMASAQVEKATKDAMNTWEMYNKNIFGSLTVDPTSSIETSGDKSFIYFNKTSKLWDKIPASTTAYFLDDELIGSNIEFNAKDFEFGDYTQNENIWDFQGILTHELGHALGLADVYFIDSLGFVGNPNCPNETMNIANGYDGAYNARTLEYGDRFGLFVLYSNIGEYAKYKDYFKIKQIKYYKYS